MVGLLDIGKITKTVQIRDKEFPITGVKLHDFVDLLSRHMELGSAIGANTIETGVNMAKLGPKVIGAFIASGLGYHGNEEQAAAAADLLPGEQMDVILAICEVTLSGDVGPFVEKLNRFGIIDALKESFKNLGRESATTLPKALNGSSELAGTPKNPSGTIHPDNSTAGLS